MSCFFYSEELFNRWNLFIKTINDYLSLLNIKAFIIQFCKHTYSMRMKNLMNIVNGAELMGAVGALAPTVFLPRPEIIYISVPLFLPRPEVVLYTCTHAIQSSSAPVVICLSYIYHIIYIFSFFNTRNQLLQVWKGCLQSFNEKYCSSGGSQLRCGICLIYWKIR